MSAAADRLEAWGREVDRADLESAVEDLFQLASEALDAFDHLTFCDLDADECEAHPVRADFTYLRDGGTGPWAELGYVRLQQRVYTLLERVVEQ